MSRIPHGETLPLEPDTFPADNMALPADGGAALAESQSLWPFGYLFRDLQQDPSNLLPASEETVKNLIKLGSREIMEDPGTIKVPGVPVPTAYTFFGQFVDHDITLERSSEGIQDIDTPNLTPLPYERVEKEIKNSRSPNLELDSVYGHKESVVPEDIPRDSQNNEKFLLGIVSKKDTLPTGKDAYNDLPRKDSADIQSDRVARIGDTRNDENLIVAQLHVAFLRAHNILIDRFGCKFDEARKMIIQHYQWIVLDDFLDRVADPAIVKSVRDEGPKFFDKSPEEFFMPLEFSVAAYRFGHSKVRESYNTFNKRPEMQSVTLDSLFTFTRFSSPTFGALDPDFNQISGRWVIDWTSFLNSDEEKFFSRPIDTTLSRKLLNIDMQNGITMSGVKRNLAIRNLLRGYLLSLPTGQAVARAMSTKSPEIRPLTEYELASVTARKEQLKVLDEAGFLKQTPLWFYILAEAAYYNEGYRLGPVGSTIVAEVLIGILRYSDYSILSEPHWRPTLGQVSYKFDLSDLLKLANVL